MAPLTASLLAGHVSGAFCGASCNGSPSARRGRRGEGLAATEFFEQGVFSLSVRVVSVTAASGAAVLLGGKTQRRLVVEVSMGDACRQETTPRDITGSGLSCESFWHFGDELCFQVRPEELAGVGLHVRLVAHKDTSFGVFSQVFSLPSLLGVRADRMPALSEAELDLRKRVFGSCLGRQRRGGSRGIIWESAPVLVPLTSRCAAGIVDPTSHLGGLATNAVLVFTLDRDPEAILAALPGGRERQPSKMSLVGCCTQASDFHTEEIFRVEAQPTGAHSVPAPPRIGGGPTPIKSPDLVPDGWVCREGPGGRKFWHHMDLGPAPWERPFEELAGQQQPASEQAALVRSMMGRVASLRGARPVRQQRARRP